ncbi:MAG: hypothetical protein II590_00055 [Clostridia bacterium]|nr:hypothetical protein [Clostridia bacterium]
MYYALIGDMVASRKLSPEERWAAQEKLSAALNRINREHSEHIAADFLITLGDEFQGLMDREADPVSAALSIMHELRPYEIRIAISFGAITTRIDRSAALGADGPAYHMARECIEGMKPNHFARLRFALPEKDLQEAVNAVSALCDRLSLYWTGKQEELVNLMLNAKLRGERLTQAALAEAMGIGQSTVNSQLTAAGFNEYCEGILFIRDALKQKGGGRS